MSRRALLRSAGLVAVAGSAALAPLTAEAATAATATLQATGTGTTSTLTLTTRTLTKADVGQKFAITMSATNANLTSAATLSYRTADGKVTALANRARPLGLGKAVGTIMVNMVGAQIIATATAQRPSTSTSAAFSAIAQIGTQKQSATATVAAVAAAVMPSASATPVAATSTATLPVAVSHGTDKKVYAHYFPQFPFSTDNLNPEQDYYTTQLLNPHGEGDKWLAEGGFLRDKPLDARHLAASDWEDQNAIAEIKMAWAAGIDGFFVEILGLGDKPETVDSWRCVTRMAALASKAQPGFEIVLQPDATCVKNTPEETADKLSPLVNSAMPHENGKVAIAPWAPEAYGWGAANSDAVVLDWWTRFCNRMAANGTPCVLWPTFLGWTKAKQDLLAPLCSTVGDWGSRTLNIVRDQEDGSGPRLAHAAGKRWVAPVAVQDYRPKDHAGYEGENTLLMREMFNQARKWGADAILIPTWNDFSESTQIAPSKQSGTSLLQLLSYYITCWKTGADWASGPIVAECAFISHRAHMSSMVPTIQTKLTVARDGVAFTDTVDVVTMLKQPATLKVAVGSTVKTVNVPAGAAVTSLPLAAGTTPELVVTRGGATVISLVSKHSVVSSNTVQDFSYLYTSSLPRLACPN